MSANVKREQRRYTDDYKVEAIKIALVVYITLRTSLENLKIGLIASH